MAWNHTGALLASASTDKTAKIWSVEGSGQGREINTLIGHESDVERVRWHPLDPQILCTASADRTVLLWDIRSNTYTSSLSMSSSSSSSSSLSMTNSPQKIAKIDLICDRKHKCPASVEWSPDGSSLAVAEKDNNVHVYDLRKILSSHKNSGGSSSNKISSRHHNRNNHLPTTSVGKPTKSYRLRPDTINECHFSPTGQHLVAATKSTDGMGNLRILENNPNLNRRDIFIVGHTGPIYCLQFSPCKTRLATGGLDALVGLWETSEMTCTSTISRLTKFIRSVAFSHDSRLLASSSEERHIDIADARTGEKVGHIEARHGADELAWNPKRYALAYASGDAPEMNIREKERVPCVAVVKISVKEIDSTHFH